jgi:hypothetical protein
VLVPLTQLVAHSEANLKLCAETSRPTAGDGSGCLQVFDRVAAPSPPRARELLPAVPVLIEDQWMQVDLSTAIVTENKTGR